MGNQQPKRSEEGLQNHQRLGPVRIVQFQDRENGQLVSTMELERIVESQIVVNSWKTQMMRIDDTESRQILLLPQKYEFIKAGMCGSGGSLHIVYQNLSYVLRGQIENRLKINRFFEEREIWYLLYNMIRAGNKFQRIKRKVGNMHPNNILINEDGQIKIIATCSIPEEVDNFELMTQNHEALAFLAPEELAYDAVQNATYPIGVNPCLAEVFSMGLSILSAGTLLECDEVYEKRKDSIKLNQNTLQNLLKSFKERYSLFLSEVVSEMLAISPNNRKSSSQLYELLYRYQNQILDLEPFAPPERYTVSESMRNSNFYPINNSQGPQMIASKTFASNVYTSPQPYQTHTFVPTIQVNQSRLPHTSLPYQQVITSSQVPGQYVQMNQSMGYSSQYHPMVSPTGQQSGIYGQKQSYAVPASSSSVISGSFYPVQQTQLSNLGSNAGIVQSNYIPNYQFRH